LQAGGGEPLKACPIKWYGKKAFLFYLSSYMLIKNIIKMQMKKVFLRLRIKTKSAKEIHQDTFPGLLFLKQHRLFQSPACGKQREFVNSATVIHLELARCA